MSSLQHFTGKGQLPYRSLRLFEDKKHPVGCWYHVAQTYDGTVHRSFVKGAVREARFTSRALAPSEFIKIPRSN
jgi:hypothetical protein